MKLRTVFSVVALVVGTSILTNLLTNAGRSVAADKAPAATAIFAQLSSPMTQKPKGAAPLLVSMESNDALMGLVHDEKKKPTDVVVKTEGAYFVIAAVQVGREVGEGPEYVDVWIKQNGKDVDNSGCRQVIPDPRFTTVLVCQGIAECKAGDTFSVAISASAPDKGLGIVAIKPKNEPVIPSVIFSMYKIN